MFKKKINIYILILVISTFAFTGFIYDRLPDLMPIHWNLAGEVDDYAGKAFGAFLSPVLMLAVWLGMVYLPHIDPKKENYKKFESSYNIIIGLLITFFWGIHMATLLISLGYKIPIDKTIFVMMGLMFIIMGNYLPKAKSNYFYGVKTPWTLSSESSWHKTHRLTGKLFVLAGFIFLISAFASGSKFKAIIMAVAIGMITVIPIGASYFYAKKDLNKNKHEHL